MLRQVGASSWIGRLGITLLILSLGRIPIPVPGFLGEIRPDSPDVFCTEWASSDHSPEAAAPCRFAIHWHWVVLSTSALCGSESEIGNESADCHPDWDSCEHDPSPQFVSTRPGRRHLSPTDLPPSGEFPALLAGHSSSTARSTLAPRSRNFAATYPRRTSSALLQRWVC